MRRSTLRLQRAENSKRSISRWSRNTSGLSSIKYAMIASVISIAIAAVVFLLGGQVNTLYQQIVGAPSG